MLPPTSRFISTGPVGSSDQAALMRVLGFIPIPIFSFEPIP
jgi:hypothetical protein